MLCITQGSTHFIHGVRLSSACLSLCMIQSNLTLVNPFALESTTAITVSVCDDVSLPLQHLSSPHPPTHECEPTHIRVPLPPMTEPFLLQIPGTCPPPHPHLPTTAAGETCLWTKQLPWPSYQRRSSLFWCLLQYLKQQVTEGFSDASVT